MWECICDCGNVKTTQGRYLIKGETKSCGCYNLECISARNKTHGDSHSKEHNAWTGIKQRCYDRNDKSYKNYGGRGITMCERWINSYENFLLDIGRAPTKKHSIERKKVNEGYSPDNCVWATSIEQANNTRKNHLITYRGETKTRAQWCRIFNIDYFKVRYRIQKGWNLDKAFLTP